jgi:hypothetical protein
MIYAKCSDAINFNDARDLYIWFSLWASIRPILNHYFIINIDNDMKLKIATVHQWSARSQFW